MRHLLHTHRFAESVRLGTPPSMRNSVLAGLQATLATALCVPLFLLSPWAHLVGFASLGALVALFGRFAPQRSRTGIVLQCAFWQTFAVFAMSATAWLGWPQQAQLALLAAFCGFYLLICVASEAWRHPPTPERPFPKDPERSLAELGFMAARVTIAAGIVVFASHALGFEHPAWAAMGAVAVMQGSHLHISMHRALQRMAGTMIGAVFAWLLLVQHPSAWLIIAVLVLLQLVTEIVIGLNYGLAQVCVTPMALLMTHLASPTAAGAAMAPERVADTLLGALIGLMIAVALSSLEDRRQLAHHHRARRPG